MIKMFIINLLLLLLLQPSAEDERPKIQILRAGNPTCSNGNVEYKVKCKCDSLPSLDSYFLLNLSDTNKNYTSICKISNKEISENVELHLVVVELFNRTRFNTSRNPDSYLLDIIPYVIEVFSRNEVVEDLRDYQHKLIDKIDNLDNIAESMHLINGVLYVIYYEGDNFNLIEQIILSREILNEYISELKNKYKEKQLPPNYIQNLTLKLNDLDQYARELNSSNYNRNKLLEMIKLYNISIIDSQMNVSVTNQSKNQNTNQSSNTKRNLEVNYQQLILNNQNLNLEDIYKNSSLPNLKLLSENNDKTNKTDIIGYFNCKMDDILDLSEQKQKNPENISPFLLLNEDIYDIIIENNLILDLNNSKIGQCSYGCNINNKIIYLSHYDLKIETSKKRIVYTLSTFQFLKLPEIFYLLVKTKVNFKNNIQEELKTYCVLQKPFKKKIRGNAKFNCFAYTEKIEEFESIEDIDSDCIIILKKIIKKLFKLLPKIGQLIALIIEIIILLLALFYIYGN